MEPGLVCTAGLAVFDRPAARPATAVARPRRFATRIMLPFAVIAIFALSPGGLPGTAAADRAGPAAAEASPPRVAVSEGDPPSQHCLTRQEQRARIAARTVVPLAQAARAARGRGGELLNARLCERDGKLVYLLTVLARSGKVLRVAVDAGTGALVDASH